MVDAAESITEYIIVLVTVPSQDQAIAIAHCLVQEQLAACVSFTPVTSVYRWQQKVHQESEWQLIIKTERRRFTDLSVFVSDIHPYEVPEIIAVPIIAGTPPYLNWISDQVGVAAVHP